MEYISAQGNIQILNTSEYKDLANRVIGWIRGCEIHDGYLSASIFQVNKYYLGVQVSCEATMSDGNELLMLIKTLGGLATVDSSITIFQEPEDPWSWTVTLNS